jgi:hypothetical protein
VPAAGGENRSAPQMSTDHDDETSVLIVGGSLVGLSTARVGVDVDDPAHRFAATYGVSDSGAVLVRPDGIVAWRAADASGASMGVIEGVLASVLALAPS